MISKNNCAVIPIIFEKVLVRFSVVVYFLDQLGKVVSMTVMKKPDRMHFDWPWNLGLITLMLSFRLLPYKIYYKSKVILMWHTCVVEILAFEIFALLILAGFYLTFQKGRSPIGFYRYLMCL